MLDIINYTYCEFSSPLQVKKARGKRTSSGNVRDIDVQELQEMLAQQEYLGTGGLGSLFKCRLASNPVSVQVLRVPILDKEEKEEFDRFTSGQFSHENIPELLRVCSGPGLYAIVTEYIPEDLFHFLQNGNEKLSLQKRLLIARDVGKALEFLHRMNVVHADLKSTNVLLTTDTGVYAKVTDFGLKKVKVACSTTISLSDPTNIIRWMAPELLIPTNQPNHKSDVYSYGMILWELSSGKIPFKDVSPIELMLSPKKEKVDDKWQLANVIGKCWSEKPDDRPSSQEVLYGVLKELEKEPKNYL